MTGGECKMVVVITRQGVDYMVELTTGWRFVRFEPPVKQLFGGVNPDDAYTDKGFTDQTIVKAAVEWAEGQKVYDGNPLQVQFIKE